MNLPKSHLVRYLGIIAMVLPVVLFSCNKKETATAPPPKVQVIKALQTTVPIPVDFVGQTYGYKDIPIRVRTDGFLTGLYFQEGSAVRKGQLLYTIDPEPLKAIEADKISKVTEAKTRMVKAESDLNRIRPLAEINAVSQRDLDAAVAEYEASKARVDAAEAELKYARINLSYTSISSPIDGIIGRTEAKTGEYVGKAPNPVVLNTVSSIDSILVNFSIGEADYIRLSRIAIERKGRINAGETPEAQKQARISLILSDGSTFDEPGRVNFLDREIDPSTGTMLIQVVFANPDKLLRPGQFARVRVVLAEVENGILIPQRCVKEFQGTYQVYTLNANNEIVVKNLKMGPKVGSMWMVESGLTADEAIVFEGLNIIRPGMKAQPEPVEIPAELKNF
jgi:membrane fusion protein (multidrug efflux system)